MQEMFLFISSIKSISLSVMIPQYFRSRCPIQEFYTSGVADKFASSLRVGQLYLDIERVIVNPLCNKAVNNKVGKESCI